MKTLQQSHSTIKKSSFHWHLQTIRWSISCKIYNHVSSRPFLIFDISTQLILQTYFANDKGRLFSTQKLNRQYEYSYEEWVKFLSQLFPADSLAIYQSNEMLNKRLKKNDRNRVYREQANQRKEDSSKNKDTEKVYIIEPD